MENSEIVIERLFNVPKKTIWNALTDPAEIRSWFFELEDFKAEVGFKFQFFGGHTQELQYLHLCEVTEVVSETKLTYSWKYDGYPGASLVSFELIGQNDKTLLILTHTGLNTFPSQNPHFALLNFEEGWNYIINKSLSTTLKAKTFERSITIDADISQVYKSITEDIALWWSSMFEGESNKEGSIFTVRFGPTVFKTFCVKQVISDQKIVWKVTDVFLDIPGLNDKKEWLDTYVEWHLFNRLGKTELHLKHIGLTPQFECFAICENGWNKFTDSLAKYNETGIGTPFIPN